MAKELKTAIRINATPDKVWTVLTDFNNYPNFNPFIRSLEGEVAVGHNIKVKITPPDANGMTFTPKVLKFEQNKEFRWIGKLLFGGLFDGEHAFVLIDNGDGTTTFEHSERFKGILVPFFKKTIDNNTRRGFEAMNAKIKALAEQL
jgi:hypothetical protein